MEKYRKIATLGSTTTNNSLDVHTFTPPSSNSSQIEEPLIQVVSADEIVFDDDFKFEDAKRKLRTVFCTSDQTSLPRYSVIIVFFPIPG